MPKIVSTIAIPRLFCCLALLLSLTPQVQAAPRPICEKVFSGQAASDAKLVVEAFLQSNQLMYTGASAEGNVIKKRLAESGQELILKAGAQPLPVSDIVGYMEEQAQLLKFAFDPQTGTAELGTGRVLWESTPEKEALVRAHAAAKMLIETFAYTYLPLMSEKEKTRARLIVEAYDANLQSLYHDEHTQLLKQMTFSEMTGVRDQKNWSLDKIVRSKRYQAGQWWMDSADLAVIDGTTSQSLLRRQVGAKGWRKIFWPRRHYNEKQQASLDLVRIAVNYHETGVPHSLEIIAKDYSGQWQPFLYEYIAGEWFPVSTVIERPGGTLREVRVKDLCLRCHVQDGRMSPRPKMMHDFEFFRKEGFSDPGIIEELLDAKNWK